MPGNFNPSFGRLAADRYGLKSHTDGYTQRHQAKDIDVVPSLVFDGYTCTEVQTALSNISDELTTLNLSGKGFITVGDGYDTYKNSISTPDTPYDASVPALNTYLHDILNNPANSLHFRIRSGGVVLIKAGTYKFTDTVNLPPGIIIMGEGFGTKIVNQMATPKPLFLVKADTARVPDGGVDATTKFMFAKQTMLLNLTIADNFVEPKFLGDLSYRNPINNNSIEPLVSLEEGAHLFCENVRFLGKTVYTAGAISNITSHAIKTNSAVPSSTGTILRIHNSFIDGFAVPVQFSAAGGVNDQFKVTTSLIRGYGFLNNSFVAASNNTILKFNACNALIADNYCFGYSSTVTSLAFIIPLGVEPTDQSKCRITVANNNMSLDRSVNSDINDTTFRFVRFSGVLNDSLTLNSYGNNFGNLRSFSIAVDAETSQVILNQDSIAFNVGKSATFTTDTVTLASALVIKTTNVTTSPYSITTDHVLFVNTSTSTKIINLPAHINGRQIKIKDISGNASVNNITLVRAGGTGTIEGVAADKVIATNWASITLVSDGVSAWYIT